KHTDEYSAVHGGKWGLDRLALYVEATRGRAATAALFRDIREIVRHSLLAVQPRMAPETRAFELYGYDVIIDGALRPWLVEVNASPSLSATTPDDLAMKSAVISDTMDVVVRDLQRLVCSCVYGRIETAWAREARRAATRVQPAEARASARALRLAASRLVVHGRANEAAGHAGGAAATAVAGVLDVEELAGLGAREDDELAILAHEAGAVAGVDPVLAERANLGLDNHADDLRGQGSEGAKGGGRAAMAKQMQVRAAAAGPTAHRGHATGLDAPSARKPSPPMVQRHRNARTLPPSSDPRRLASARQQPEWLQAVTTARQIDVGCARGSAGTLRGQALDG
ncbi:Ttll1, partial [Symbiodinium sp. KB8]